MKGVPGPLLAVPAAVVGEQYALVPDRLGDPCEVRDGVGVAEPGRGVQVEAVLEAAGPFGEGGGQRGLELELGGGQIGSEAQLLRGARRTGEEERARLGVGEAGEPGAVAVHEPVAAGGAAVGVDGDAGGAEGFDVAVDGADRHLQFGGQFGCGHPAAVLQQEEQGEEPVSAHGDIVRDT